MPTLTFTPNMTVGGVVLALTFIAIFIEQLHGVGHSRLPARARREWFRKGTPAMLARPTAVSIVFVSFFERPLR